MLCVHLSKTVFEITFSFKHEWSGGKFQEMVFMQLKRIFIAGLFLILVSTGCRDSGCWYQEIRDLYYGIPVQVRYYPENTQLTARVWAYLESIDDVFNDYKSGSEISAINRRNDAGDVTLSPMLADAFGKARQAWQFSEEIGRAHV